MRRSWVRIPSAPLKARRLRPAGFSLALAVASLFAGCDSGRVGEKSSAPPVPVAPATPPEGVSVAELRRQLGANRNAQFVRAGGEVTEVDLTESGVADLGPLKDLPLKKLGISGLAVTDLAPLAGMPLEQLVAENVPIADLTPLKGMPLKDLSLRETKVADLSPLVGAPIEMLNVVGTPVTDISAIRDMPLNTLWVASTQVKDLSPLAGKSLTSLDIENTPVADLSVLTAMSSLRRLNIAESAVTDLTPLSGLQLERLIFTPAKIGKGLDVARGMTSLREVGLTFDDVMPAAAFWQRYDAGEFRAPGTATETPSP